MNVAEHAEQLAALLDEQGPDSAFEAAIALPHGIAVEVLETLVATRGNGEQIEIPDDPRDEATWPASVASVLFCLTREGLAATSIGSRALQLCGELISLRQGRRKSDRAAFDAVMAGRTVDASEHLPEGTTCEAVDASIRLREAKLAIASVCMDPESSMADVVMEVFRQAEQDGKAQRVEDGMAIGACYSLNDLKSHAVELTGLYVDRVRELGGDLPEDHPTICAFRLGASLAVGLPVFGPAANKRRAVEVIESMVVGIDRKDGGS